MPIRKSRVSGVVASGTTADRPSNPSIGDTFFNGTLGVQEIYTTSGWLPATGANDFNVVLTGSETSVTLDKEYFSGAYTIASALSDTSFDVYLFDASNNALGYSNSPSINATGNFNKIIIYGGTPGDLLSFAYKTTFTTSATTADTFAPPYVTSVSVADLANIDDTTTITGGNFDTDIEVYFDGANSYSQQAKSVVYGSSTSIVATRPDDFLEDNAPYTIRVVNPGTTNPTGSNRNKLVDSITAGGDPTWITNSGNIANFLLNNASAVTVQATDPDESAISYSFVSGSLPPGISFNSTTGEISGTPTGSPATYNFVISASDPENNVTARSFEIETGLAGSAEQFAVAVPSDLESSWSQSGYYWLTGPDTNQPAQEFYCYYEPASQHFYAKIFQVNQNGNIGTHNFYSTATGTKNASSGIWSTGNVFGNADGTNLQFMLRVSGGLFPDSTEGSRVSGIWKGVFLRQALDAGYDGNMNDSGIEAVSQDGISFTSVPDTLTHTNNNWNISISTNSSSGLGGYIRYPYGQAGFIIHGGGTHGTSGAYTLYAIKASDNNSIDGSTNWSLAYGYVRI